MNILFFIQIILELLPISSSGHINIICKLIDDLYPLSFMEDLFAHLPTAIIQLFLAFYFFISQQDINFMHKIKNLFNISISAIPTAIIILLIKKISKYVYIDIPIYYGLMITSYLLFSLMKTRNKKNIKEDISMNEGLLLGILQGFAIIPGVSRFAVFLFSCKMMNFSHRYSFFLAMISNIGLSFGGLVYAFINIYYFNTPYNLIWNMNDTMLLIFSSILAYFALFLTYKLYIKNKFIYLGIYEFLLSIYCYFKFS